MKVGVKPTDCVDPELLCGDQRAQTQRTFSGNIDRVRIKLTQRLFDLGVLRQAKLKLWVAWHR